MGAVALSSRGRASPRALPRPEVARLVAFVPIALFGGLTWASLVAPAQGGEIILAVLAAVAGALVLIAVPADAPAPRRLATGCAVTIVLLLVALLAAGVPLTFFAPRHLDDLVVSMADGIAATPGVTVPYRGADEWARTAILAGGTGLVCLAALLAFWPRAPRASQAPTSRTDLAPARHGHHFAAAIALGTLYAVPIIEDAPDHPWLGGAVFCVFMAAFLWLERLRSDQVAIAGSSMVAAAILGALIAPRLDADQPWFDYESFVAHLEPKHAETFSWDHRYGPLDWPRDGRELLRIKAKTQVYWKAENLDDFDGVRWHEAPQSRTQPDARINPRWVQQIRVVDRGLRTREFVGSGQTLSIARGASKDALPVSGGTFVTARGPLKPGDSYRAQTYTPRPTDGQLRRSGTHYPGSTDDFVELDLPVLGAARQVQDPVAEVPLGPVTTVRFPAFGSTGDPQLMLRTGLDENPRDAQTVLRSSPYARMYALAQSLRRTAQTPYQYVLAVRERVQQGATYDENPPRVAYPLETFVFDDRRGYCQQFSGAMAMLLRMGGLPARVAAGFSPGGIDRTRKEFVIRDTDAHSWVEAYFPPYGWITMDPTPAASPALSQLDDIGNIPANGGQSNLLGSLGQAGDRPFASGDSRTNLAPPQQGRDWRRTAAAVAVVVALVALGGWWLWRRRTPFHASAPELAELERALHRSGRRLAPDATLARLEGVLGGSDAAAGYVRAVRDQRYRGVGEGPSVGQRRALRSQLAAGLGTAGRLRALWALPPRLPGRAPPSRRTRSYTGG
jgi:protein-glutamine gamma-glutamyltransferase